MHCWSSFLRHQDTILAWIIRRAFQRSALCMQWLFGFGSIVPRIKVQLARKQARCCSKVLVDPRWSVSSVYVFTLPIGVREGNCASSNTVEYNCGGCSGTRDCRLGTCTDNGKVNVCYRRGQGLEGYTQPRGAGPRETPSSASADRAAPRTQHQPSRLVARSLWVVGSPVAVSTPLSCGRPPDWTLDGRRREKAASQCLWDVLVTARTWSTDEECRGHSREF